MQKYEKNTDFAGIFTMRPRDSVGNHIAASPYRGDESDMKPVIDFGTQVIDINVYDVCIGSGFTEDAGERLVPAVASFLSA